jgi:CRISPR-associated endonuclease/helicase Cas3
MFDSLVAFLKHFDVPVLCMTATLPATEIKQLRNDCGLRVFPDETEASELRDLQAKERAPRYLHRPVSSKREAFEVATKAWRDEKRRVLWVVNVVARAQALAGQLERELGSPVLCYHSRYRLKDRQPIHDATVVAFKQSGAPAIAVTTQVCEMSLDLDAEVLITEHAPVTSLVQRFGRANRHLADPQRLGELVTYPPEDGRPYGKEELAGAEGFLAALGSKPVSQADLAELLRAHAPSRRLSTGDTSFLESGYYAVPGDFRETDDYAQQAVLDADLADVLAALKERRPIDGWLVPVPRRQLMERPPRASELAQFLGVAPAGCYSPNRGFVAP